MNGQSPRKLIKFRYTSNGPVEIYNREYKSNSGGCFVFFWKVMIAIALIFAVVILPCLEYGIIRL